MTSLFSDAEVRRVYVNPISFSYTGRARPEALIVHILRAAFTAIEPELRHFDIKPTDWLDQIERDAVRYADIISRLHPPSPEKEKAAHELMVLFMVQAKTSQAAVQQLALKQQELDGARIDAEQKQARLAIELHIARELNKIYGRLSFWERLCFAFTGGIGPKP